MREEHERDTAHCVLGVYVPPTHPNPVEYINVLPGSWTPLSSSMAIAHCVLAATGSPSRPRALWKNAVANASIAFGVLSLSRCDFSL